MTDINKYVLSRHVPADMAREVRIRDGFGCVHCGSMLPLEYEHFDPEFKDAREHLAKGIVLLCGCCHGKKGTFLSKATIARSAARPKCRQLGFARGAFDPGIESPEIVIGTVRMTGTTTLLRNFGNDVLSVLPPEESGGPFRINADLRNRDGTPVLRMVDNVIEADTANWDVEVKGSRITFRNALRDVSLVMRSEPGERIVFERLKPAHRGCKIDGQEGKSISIDQNGTFLHAVEGEIFGAEIGIDISNNGVSLGTGSGSGVNGVIFKSLSIGSTRVPPVKLRRNSTCSCGSGRRFKHCHGAIAGLAP